MAMQNGNQKNCEQKKGKVLSFTQAKRRKEIYQNKSKETSEQISENLEEPVSSLGERVNTRGFIFKALSVTNKIFLLSTSIIFTLYIISAIAKLDYSQVIFGIIAYVVFRMCLHPKKINLGEILSTCINLAPFIYLSPLIYVAKQKHIPHNLLLICYILGLAYTIKLLLVSPYMQRLRDKIPALSNIKFSKKANN